MNPTRGGWVILLSVFAAMLLSVLHLPETWPQWLGWLRPNWMLLVLFFWVMELPHRIGLIAAWVIGLLLDALLGEPLGLNGLLLASVTFVTWRFFERLRMYALAQQCATVFALVLGAELVRYAVITLGSERALEWQLIWVAVASTVIWPFLFVLLMRIKTAVRVE